MYTIEITTRQPISEKQRQTLKQFIQDADSAAACQIEHTSCKISSGSTEPAKLSYLLGLAAASSAASEIIRLLLVYEKE